MLPLLSIGISSLPDTILLPLPPIKMSSLPDVIPVLANSLRNASSSSMEVSLALIGFGSMGAEGRVGLPTFLLRLGSSVRPTRFPLWLTGPLPRPRPPKPPLPPQLKLGGGGGRLGTKRLTGRGLGMGAGGTRVDCPIALMMEFNVSTGM